MYIYIYVHTYIHYITLHCITLHYIPFHSIPFRSISFHSDIHTTFESCMASNPQFPSSAAAVISDAAIWVVNEALLLEHLWGWTGETVGAILLKWTMKIQIVESPIFGNPVVVLSQHVPLHWPCCRWLFVWFVPWWLFFSIPTLYSLKLHLTPYPCLAPALQPFISPSVLVR